MTWPAFPGGGIILPSMPKVKIILPPGFPEEEPFDLEQAAYHLNFNSGIVQIDGQRIRSYDELVQLASQDKYRNKDYIEVVVILLIAGG